MGKEIKKAQLGNLSFGVHLAKSSDNDYAFVTGKLTAESQMPTAGKATYAGKAFYGSEESQGFVDGTSAFTVDFANKTVNGEINVRNRTIKLLEAKIDGNKFEAKQGGNGNKEWVRGNFFGENVAELGGVWEREVNRKGEGAVFGATKR
ncbi:MAG: Slam-dependent surface lipoprotein [Pasteurellaceae bacterium]|nr:Slam-dependent surface lipoprotein [Pasteurellaceae bacterium]